MTEQPSLMQPGRRVYGAPIGIAMMDRRFPRPVGDMGNASSFHCPVQYDIVHGVNGMPAMTVEQTSNLFQPLLDSCMRLVDQGVGAITTTCGYAALLQGRLAGSLPVPFAASSLLQLASVLATLPETARVAVLAARAGGLTRAHLEGAGVAAEALWRITIADLQDAPAFRQAILDAPGQAPLDVDRATQDVVALCRATIEHDPNIGAFVAECANVGPYSEAIRQATGLPVWDGVTLVNSLYAGLPKTP